MEETTITLHSEFRIGEVDERIFGGFMEHVGRCVYEGVYDPDCSCADEDGFRNDVAEALGRLKMTAMRYPGGNFASGYHWLDGVGPRGRRPTVRDLAWNSIEPNRFGTDEYVKLCRKMSWTPMIAVNLGTGGPEEAANWVEYCNYSAGTKFADMRVANGSLQPHAVKLWCLGNEMDGDWQIGHLPAEQYAVLAQQSAKMMKDVDDTIELVVCGTCHLDMKTYAEWDRKVLEHVGDFADYISMHRYVGEQQERTNDFLAVTNSIDRQIEDMDAVCRFVQAKRRSSKRAYLCFDEWNVNHRSGEPSGVCEFAQHILEEVYNLEDALVVAGFLHSIIRHADVVKIANLAQIVNAIAPVMTCGDEILIQSFFYTFEMFSSRRRGVSLTPSVNGPVYESKSYGSVHYIDTSAILDGDSLHVFATNRSLNEPADVCVKIADRSVASLGSAELLTGPDAKAANSFDQPDVIKSRPFSDVIIADGQAVASLPPMSLAAMTFKLG